MFVREKDDKAELWDGARSGVQAAVDVFNADEVRFQSQNTQPIANISRRVMSITSIPTLHLSSKRPRRSTLM